MAPPGNYTGGDLLKFLRTFDLRGGAWEIAPNGTPFNRFRRPSLTGPPTACRLPFVAISWSARRTDFLLFGPAA